MARIDKSTIEGFDGMTLEQKVEALLGLEIPDSAEIERLKASVSKANSEAANWKRKHNDLLSAEEQKKQEEAEKLQEIQDELATLRREKTMSDYVAKFVAQGYTPELASETAAALIDGKMDTVFNNQASFLKAFGEQIKADLQKGTPPPSSGNGGKKPQDMNYAELCQYLADNPGAEL